MCARAVPGVEMRRTVFRKRSLAGAQEEEDRQAGTGKQAVNILKHRHSAPWR